jgi:hypothetical protein
MNGLESPHKLLSEYIKRHTTCLPGDSSGITFTSNEPQLHIDVEIKKFDWDRLRRGTLVLQLSLFFLL